jgi:MerR family transcriptional regulator, heat shock protein HspR
MPTKSSDISDNPLYTISTASNLLNISIHTLRMYEREGLIIPFKKVSNQRLYSDRDLERIRCIRKSISEEKMGIEGIRRVLSLIPCWGIRNCSKKDKQKCQAFNEYSKPCWMLKHKNNYCSTQTCRECVVYFSFGNCSSIKDKLKEIIL